MTVSITGMGALTPAGLGVEALWQKTVSSETLASNGVVRFPQKTTPIGAAMVAAKQALANAGWETLTEEDGFILGTTVGQAPHWETTLVQYLCDKTEKENLAEALKTLPLGNLADRILESLECKAQSFVVTSACSASTQALALATEWIKSGRIRRCLVGGVELLSTLTLQGFESLQLLSKDPARPFDKTRNGINLSEASVFLCLEPNAKSPLADITGYGLSTDAYHATSPQPEGAGSYRAMKAALEMAGLTPQDISWVHAHGTGSLANDLAEGTAVKTLLGEKVPISSTKGVHGHALGASGVLETALCVTALQKQFILKTTGLTEPDTQIHVHHVPKSEPFSLNHIMKNTLGFGGNNAALVLSKRRTP